MVSDKNQMEKQEKSSKCNSFCNHLKDKLNHSQL